MSTPNWIHCTDCDPSFTCWQGGAGGCRKQPLRPPAAPPSEPLPTEGETRLANRIVAGARHTISGADAAILISAFCAAQVQEATAAKDAEIERLKQWNMDRAGQFACDEVRLGNQVARLEEKYRLAALGLEKIVAFHCDAQATAQAALKACIKVGDSDAYACALKEARAQRDSLQQQLKEREEEVQKWKTVSVDWMDAHKGAESRCASQSAQLKRMEGALVEARATLLGLQPDFGGPVAAQMGAAIQRITAALSSTPSAPETTKEQPMPDWAKKATDKFFLSHFASAPAQDGEGQITDTQILDWLEKNRGEVRETEVGRWNASSPRVLYASQNSVREAVRFAITASTEAKSLSAPDSTNPKKD
jgi:hypothetical protein